MAIDFTTNRPIFKQIADSICDRILQGEFPPGSKIKSVRELGADLQVNINTVMRAIEYLQQRDILFIKRGIGNFVADNAAAAIRQLRRQTFLTDEIDYFFRQLDSIEIQPDELADMYRNFRNSQSKTQPL